MQQHGHKIESKRGKKFVAGHDNWSIYYNFLSMNSYCYEEMIAVGVTKKLETPVCLDKDSFECVEEDAFGQKVTHTITNSEYCIVAEKVGGNTNQSLG